MSQVIANTVILNAITESFKSQREHNERLVEQFTKLLMEANGNIEPTVDVDGRLHAPLDGYQSECGHVFRKGQYIPMKTDQYSGTERLKVRVRGEQFINSLKADDAFSDNLGSTWIDANSVMTCNLYISGIAHGFTKSVEEAVKRVQDSYNIEIKEHTLDGKVAVTGKVIGFWQKHSEYGVQEGFNVTLDNDGATYSGTLPKALWESKEGDTVSFTANFSEGSKYFKRPSKAKILAS